MTHILHTRTAHKTASLTNEGNSAYCQSGGAHNIKHNLWKSALRSHLDTDVQARDRTQNFLLTRTMFNMISMRLLIIWS